MPNKNHEYDVLEQAITRVRATANQNELLFRVFCFASTGTRSWLVFCERCHDLKILSDGVSSGNTIPCLKEIYHIIPIAATHILSIWKSISQAARNKNYYVHADAFFLAEILKCMQFDLAYSRIKILGNSGRCGSLVYGVSPGHPYCAENSKRNCMYFSLKPSFAIKIHQSQWRCRNEINILKQLRTCKVAAKYVVGIFISTIDESDSSRRNLAFDDFELSRLISSTEPNMKLSSSLSSSGDLDGRSLGLQCFDRPAVTGKPRQELKFSLESVRNKGNAFVNDWLDEVTRLDPKDVWWVFNETISTTTTTPCPGLKVDASSMTKPSAIEERSERMDSVDAETIFTRTAVLMHMSCDRVPLNLESARHLTEQLREIHKCRVLHTDTRITNIASFSLDVDENQNPVVREYIIDFDLSARLEPGDEYVEIDVSHRGARRDLALKVKNLSPHSEGDYSVKWYNSDDFTALCMCQQTLENLASSSLSNTNLSGDFDSSEPRLKKFRGSY